MSPGAVSQATCSPAREPGVWRTDSRRGLLLGLSLAALTLLTYRGALEGGFVFDDGGFITENPHVRQGLTAESVAWAFSTFRGGNWQPLSYLSHMLDVQLFGLQPAGHHLTSVALHAANAVLLLWVLLRLTGAPWRSWLVAALFAVHPLHVESVAWVSERKDVLSTFFLLLALAAYRAHAARPGAGRYLLAATLFVMGLMAKPMLVSLPLVLLLLDWWPLRRDAAAPRRPWRALLLEKVPLLGIAAAFSILALLSQQRAGTLGSLLKFPLALRVENALLSCVAYITQTLWPTGLACLYPYTFDAAAWKVGGAALLLAGVSFAIVRLACARRYLATGWLWYLVTLLPVIGLVQVGVQSRADRYTYIPSIGLFIMMVWGIADVATRRVTRPARAAAPARLLRAAAVAVVAVLALQTAVQVRYWRDDLTLFGRAVEVTEANATAHYNLGTVLEKQGRLEEALAHLVEAVRINPDNAQVRNNIGHIRARRGDWAGAAREFAAELAADPRDALARFNLGFALAKLGEPERAKAHFLEALAIDPELQEAHYSLGNALFNEERLAEAAVHFRAALQVGKPFALAPEAHNNLGIILSRQRRFDEAVSEFHEALRLRPDYAGARDNLALALRDRGGEPQPGGRP